LVLAVVVVLLRVGQLVGTLFLVLLLLMAVVAVVGQVLVIRLEMMEVLVVERVTHQAITVGWEQLDKEIMAGTTAL
jgi:hypothetical protein